MKKEARKEASMGLWLRVVPLFSLVVLLNGCLVADTTLTLKPDGSGTIAIDYSMDEDAGVQLKGILSIRQAVALAADPTFTPSPIDHWIDSLASPAAHNLDDDLAPCRAAGFFLEPVRIKAHEGRREVHIMLAFTNIADLTRLDIFPHLGLELRPTEAGDFQIRRISHPIGSALTASLTDATYLQQIAPVFTGLMFRVAFVSPSPILATSGNKTSPTRVEWLFSFDKDPSDIVSLQNQELSATFEGKGLVLPELK